MTILVLTVGGSHQPLVTAVQSLKPDLVAFLCSDDTQAARGSYVQVVGEGKVTRSHPNVERPDLPNIVTLTGLGPEQYRIVRIQNFDNLEYCYLEARRVLEALHREHGEARVVADYTGGTKSMTAGLALAAVDDERCEINLVTGTRADLDRVRDQTQFSRPVVVWDLRARRKLEEVRERLSRYDYAGATALLEAIGRMPISEALLQRITAGIAVCRGLDAWDRFDHQGARTLLEPYRKDMVDWCIALDDLCRAEPRNPYMRAEDLLLNAERRAAQGRYDDAVARVYRAVELIAQVRLKTRHGIDTGDADLQKIPEHIRVGLERYRSDGGKIQLPLFAAWGLLRDVADEPLGAWFARNRSRIQDFLSSRNFSILAHGDRPVDQARYDSVGKGGIALCREALADVALPGKKSPTLPQLPQKLSALEDGSGDAVGPGRG